MSVWGLETIVDPRLTGALMTLLASCFWPLKKRARYQYGLGHQRLCHESRGLDRHRGGAEGVALVGQAELFAQAAGGPLPARILKASGSKRWSS